MSRFPKQAQIEPQQQHTEIVPFVIHDHQTQALQLSFNLFQFTVDFSAMTGFANCVRWISG